MSATPADFSTCLDFVLTHEGGSSDVPADRGGVTNLGVTMRTLSQWRGRAVTKEDVRTLGKEEAAEIYRREYWEASRCAELPPALALTVFDTAVNSGPVRAVMFLQSALEVPADGVPGRETMAAARACDPRETALRVIALRRAFLEGLPGWNVFGAGWSSRLNDLEEAIGKLT